MQGMRLAHDLAVAGLTLAAMASISGVALVAAPGLIRRFCEALWALAWSVDAGREAYGHRRRQAASGGLDVEGSPSNAEAVPLDLVRALASCIQDAASGVSRTHAMRMASATVRANRGTVNLDTLTRAALQSLGYTSAG